MAGDVNELADNVGLQLVQKLYTKAIYDEACRLCSNDGLGSFDLQPVAERERYMNLAHRNVREYLASCGMV